MLWTVSDKGAKRTDRLHTGSDWGIANARCEIPLDGDFENFWVGVGAGGFCSLRKAAAFSVIAAVGHFRTSPTGRTAQGHEVEGVELGAVA